MKKLLVLCLISATSLAAAERPEFYPFDVTLGGVKAEVKEGNTEFAEVAKPVAPDAVLTLEKKVPVLWVTVLPCKEDGTVNLSIPVAIIHGQDTKEVKLDASELGNKLTPGIYFACVEGDVEAEAAVGAESGANIVFVVAAPDEKPDAKPEVDFSKVLGFLKKKAVIDK